MKTAKAPVVAEPETLGLYAGSSSSTGVCNSFTFRTAPIDLSEESMIIKKLSSIKDSAGIVCDSGAAAKAHLSKLIDD